MTPPGLHDAFHLADGLVAGSLRQLKVTRLLGVFDALTTGPVDLDPKRHKAARAKHWREFDRLMPRLPGTRHRPFREPTWAVRSANDVRRALRHRGHRPLVLWGGSAWEDHVMLWWACDALQRCGVASTEIWLARSNGPSKRVGVVEPEELPPLYAELVRPMTASMLRAGARQWASFVAGNLGRLQSSSVAAFGPIPEMATTFIPQVFAADASRLWLSSYDQRLLGMFASGEWATAQQKLGGETQRIFISLMDGHGDLLIIERLQQWARDVPHVFESRRAANAKSFFGAMEYRLTPHGQALLEHGIVEPRDCSPMWVGGYCAYAAKSRWLVERGDEAWRFVPPP